MVLRSKGAIEVHKKILLCAFGITVDGKQEIIDFYPSPSESKAAWEAFLNDLYRRGLHGDRCELRVTDGGTGLHGALEIIYPKIAYQRCWAHNVSRRAQAREVRGPPTDKTSRSVSLGEMVAAYAAAMKHVRHCVARTYTGPANKPAGRT